MLFFEQSQKVHKYQNKMNPSSYDIKDMLEAESSLGLVFNQNLFIGLELEVPHNVVTIFDTTSAPPMLTYQQGENYFFDGIQIRVRNKDYGAGYLFAHQIMLSLHGRGQETWNGTLYSAIICSSGPAHLDWDSNHRARFIINFEIQRR